MHLYEEVGRLHIWEGQLKVLDDIDATGLVDTDGFYFRGIRHGITELIELRRYNYVLHIQQPQVMHIVSFKSYLIPSQIFTFNSIQVTET